MSLRLRLLLAAGFVTLVALVAADTATYSVLRTYLVSQVDQQLEQSHPPIEQALDSGHVFSCTTLAGGLENANGDNAGNPGASGAPGGGSPGPGPGTGGGDGDEDLRNPLLDTFFEVRTPSGRVVDDQMCIPFVGGTRRAPALPTTIGGFSRAPNGEMVTYFTVPSTGTGGPAFRVRASVLANGDELVLAVPLTGTASTLHGLLLTELGVSLAALLAAAILGWWLVRVGLRPLADAERTAEAIAAGNLEHRVPGESGTTEIGRLARALNVMLGRIQSAFAARDATEARLRASEARLRQFVADASHELRTPVAAVGAYAELFGRGASAQPDDLDRVMRGIRSETARMARLVEDLLVLARMDEGQTGERRPGELVALCAEAVDSAQAVGPEWPAHLEATQPVEVDGDPVRLRQVVDNLLANVRAHTTPGTAATVSVHRAGTEAIVTVADDGPGVDPEHVAHLFERFYRSDKSRARASGGSGLGLAIVAAIVAAHHGRVEAESARGEGLRVTVHLPLGVAHRAGPDTTVVNSPDRGSAILADGRRASSVLTGGPGDPPSV